MKRVFTKELMFPGVMLLLGGGMVLSSERDMTPQRETLQLSVPLVEAISLAIKAFPVQVLEAGLEYEDEGAML